MKTIGIEGHGNWAFVATCEESAPPQIQAFRTTFDTLQFIIELQDNVDLVLLQDRQGNDTSDFINRLVPTLTELRSPFRLVSPKTTYEATFGWTACDTMHAAILAEYGLKRIAANSRDVQLLDFLCTAVPGLYRYWPRFEQEGLPALYVELVRQTRPGEPRFDVDETLSNCGLVGENIDVEVQKLEAENLVRRRSDTILLYGALGTSRFNRSLGVGSAARRERLDAPRRAQAPAGS